jgi:hypothetical protein
MYKVVTSTIVGFFSGAIVVLAFMNNFNYGKEIASRNTFASKTENILANPDPYITEINRLKKQIEKLKIDRGVLSESLHKNIESQPLDCSAAIHSAIQAADKKNELINELQRIESLADYNLQLQQDFDDEERDHIWASETEAAFHYALKADASTQSIAVSTVICKTKTCEVTVPANQNLRNEIVDALSNYSFLALSGFKNSSTKSKFNNTNEEIKLYISNNP